MFSLEANNTVILSIDRVPKDIPELYGTCGDSLASQNHSTTLLNSIHYHTTA
ncbi:hypothetical protein BB559_002998 [Furculomyces boomerangus]|uniref:Uncharacterized protein n=1 Tax=Furculomyces boomerangus TaxID=61424 RepID=A0A2T9YQ75_9FUNG|nr:hypothetical protein BB559_002998 [Furculomyces boomerangus]